eukprot:68076-Rhodomonas_salina.1
MRSGLRAFAITLAHTCKQLGCTRLGPARVLAELEQRPGGAASTGAAGAAIKIKKRGRWRGLAAGSAHCAASRIEPAAPTGTPTGSAQLARQGGREEGREGEMERGARVGRGEPRRIIAMAPGSVQSKDSTVLGAPA